MWLSFCERLAERPQALGGCCDRGARVGATIGLVERCRALDDRALDDRLVKRSMID